MRGGTGNTEKLTMLPPAGQISLEHADEAILDRKDEIIKELAAENAWLKERCAFLRRAYDRLRKIVAKANLSGERKPGQQLRMVWLLILDE